MTTQYIGQGSIDVRRALSPNCQRAEHCKVHRIEV